MTGAGDNSDKVLKSYAERIAGLMDQIKDIKTEVKDELKAAKQVGLDVKALLKVVKEMAMDEDQRSKQLEFDLVVGDYRRAVGLLSVVEQDEAA